MNNNSTAYTDMLDMITGLSYQLLTNKANYGEDINTIFHEIYHQADFIGHKGKTKDKIVMGKGTGLVGDDFLIDLVKRYVNAKGLYERQYKLCDPISSGSLENIVEGYIHAQYVLDPAEIGARNFAIKLQEKLVSFAKERGVESGVEFSNISKISKYIKVEKESEEQKLKFANEALAIYSPQITQVIKEARAMLLKKDDEGKNELDKAVTSGWLNTRGVVCMEDLFIGLMVDYDDEVAHQLMDKMLSLNDDDYEECWGMISSLAMYSNYTFTDKQIDILRDRGACDDVDLERLIDLSNRIEIVD